MEPNAQVVKKKGVSTMLRTRSATLDKMQDKCELSYLSVRNVGPLLCSGYSQCSFQIFGQICCDTILRMSLVRGVAMTSAIRFKIVAGSKSGPVDCETRKSFKNRRVQRLRMTVKLHIISVGLSQVKFSISGGNVNLAAKDTENMSALRSAS